MLTVIVSIATGLSIMCFVWAVGLSMGRRFASETEQYGNRLRGLYVRSITPRQLTLLIYLGTALVCLSTYLTSYNLIVSIVAGILAYILPGQILDYLWIRRMRRFDIQLTEGLSFLANNLRSGMALPQAIESLVTNSDAPLAEEFALTVREYTHGRTLPEAFASMRQRVPSENLNLILMAIEICQQQGGNIAELLDTIGDDLREMYDIGEKVKGITAEGRLQAKLLALSPLILGLMMYVAQPEMQEAFYGNIVGMAVIVFAALLTLGGFTWMKKIVNINV